MIAEFLQAEIDSARFREGILTALQGMDERIIRAPDLGRDDENRLRRAVLGTTRGYGRNKDLFEGFPADVTWYHAQLTSAELESVMYIDYSYWNLLSGQTRLPIRARSNIQQDVRIFDVSNQGFRDISRAMKSGKTFPRLILVAMNEQARMVVLEGHARLTGLWLEPDLVPDVMEVIIGFSEGLDDWDLY